MTDGRMFGWQRALTGITPVIVWDKLNGGVKNFEFVGGLHLMKPEQYGMTLTELAAEFPAPVVQPE